MISSHKLMQKKVVDELKAEIDALEKEIAAIEDHDHPGSAWPPGSNPNGKIKERHMGEEWVTFNSTHFFLSFKENQGSGSAALLDTPLGRSLRGDVDSVIWSTCNSSDYLGWMHFDPSRY